ncbi:hypothetical protein [Desulfovibrio falkowii]|uniref:hypothetical protein n=1 Tax=Desulfovibrio sp. WGS1351 TaxID=3366814 RepID=UPI00372D7013
MAGLRGTALQDICFLHNTSRLQGPVRAPPGKWEEQKSLQPSRRNILRQDAVQIIGRPEGRPIIFAGGVRKGVPDQALEQLALQMIA